MSRQDNQNLSLGDSSSQSKNKMIMIAKALNGTLLKSQLIGSLNHFSFKSMFET